MDITNDLNQEQKEAVLITDRPLLIIAGAGSGKTRVITKKIAYLINSGLDAFNILALTFTNKAAKEMRERAEYLMPCAKNAWISTFHSICVRILRREIEVMDYKKNFSIADSNDSNDLLKECFKKLNLGKEYQIKNVAAKISFAKSKLIFPKDFCDSDICEDSFRAKKICDVYKIYQDKLKQANALDFDDIISFVINIFKNHDDILNKYKNKFKYILVDEYQDTNPAQYYLIKLLTRNSKNICVVGDDDQSIYSWRGADIKNILDFEKDFDNAKIIKLEQNYRSTQIILDGANAVIKNNTQRKQKKLWTHDKSGENIILFSAETAKDEAEFIAQEINKKNFSYKEIAILYRNNFQSRVIEDKFISNNIPYRLVGGTRFYDRMEIKDLIAYLKLINNPDDGIAFLRAVSVPKRGIGEKTLEKLSNIAYENKISNFNAINILDLKKNSLKEFYDLINRLINFSKSSSIYSLLEKIIFDINYYEYIKKFDNYTTRLENIEEFLAKINEFEVSSENKKSLTDFLEQVSLLSDVDNSDQDNNAVSLMTLHGAKGLEFPCVFIFGANKDIIPGYHDLKHDIEEERRLFYVGMTRAKKKLYITYSRYIFSLRQSKLIKSEISPFVNEIPEELIKKFSNTYNNNSSNKYKFNFNLNKLNSNIDFAFKIKNKNYLFDNKITNKLQDLNYIIGDKVRHNKFGICMVKDIKKNNNDFHVTLTLPDGTDKIFASSYLNLEVIK